MALTVTSTEIVHSGLWEQVFVDGPGGNQEVVHNDPTLGLRWKVPVTKEIVRWVLNAGGDPENPNDYTKTWVSEFYRIPPDAAPTTVTLAASGTYPGMTATVTFDLPTNPQWYTGASVVSEDGLPASGGGNNETDRINSLSFPVSLDHSGQVLHVVVRHYVKPGTGGLLGPSTSSDPVQFGPAV